MGTCASGKTTLVKALVELGVNAHVCAQEHSEIPTLWNHTLPDFVVLLDIDLETLRRRRSNGRWPETIYQAQQRRLAGARRVANLVIDTSVVGKDETVALVLKSISDQLASDNDGET